MERGALGPPIQPGGAASQVWLSSRQSDFRFECRTGSSLPSRSPIAVPSRKHLQEGRTQGRPASIRERGFYA